MRLKEIRRTAATSWCPVAPFSNYMVAGSIAGSLTDFAAQPKLEILDTSFSRRRANGDSSSLVVGSITTSERFTKVSWSNEAASNSSSSPVSTTSSDLSSETQEVGGLIAGALVDGSIGIWDPRAIINGDNDQDEIDMGMIAKLDKHTAAVRGLEFNPKQSNLLASAGDDSQLYIWNLKQPEKPTLHNLTGGSTGSSRNPHHQQIITDLQWNRQFESILGTTAQNGTCVVWDLKQKKPIVPFSNSQRRKRYSSIAWNPEMFAQLAVASEDDSCPVIEIWDLRKAFAPLMELDGKKSSAIPGHNRGILSISWCPDDSQLLLSSGKDNRALIWNPSDGEVLGEIHSGQQGEQGGEFWMYNVQWSHKPSICSTSSFDGRISIHSLVDSSADEEMLDDEEEDIGEGLKASDSSGNDFMSALGPISDISKQKKEFQRDHMPRTIFKTAPKWLKRPAAATFGFGNQLVSFNSENRNIAVKQVPADAPFVKRAKLLDQTLRSGDFSTFCDGRVKEGGGFVWQVMASLFAQDKRAGLLEFLGFEKQKIEEEVQQCLSNDVVKEKVEVGQTNDELLTKTIMTSDFENAVKICINSNRMDDALMLAAMGGTDLWNQTRDLYLEKQQQKQRPIMGILRSVLQKDLKGIVERSDPADWKNTLSVVCTFAPKDDDDQEFKELCAMLADKILSCDAGNKTAATEEGDRVDVNKDDATMDIQSLSSEMVDAVIVCLLCARDVTRTLSIWSQQQKTTHDENSDGDDTAEDTYAVLDTAERTTVLRELCQARDVQLPQCLIDKIILFAELLASEGLFASALHFLNGVLTSLKSLPENVIVLRDHVYYALHKPFGPIPTPPFVVKKVSGRGSTKKPQTPQQQQQRLHPQATSSSQQPFQETRPPQPAMRPHQMSRSTAQFTPSQQQPGYQHPSAPFQPQPQPQPQPQQSQPPQPGFQRLPQQGPGPLRPQPLQPGFQQPQQGPTPFQPQPQQQPQPLQPGFQQPQQPGFQQPQQPGFQQPQQPGFQQPQQQQQQPQPLQPGFQQPQPQPLPQQSMPLQPPQTMTPFDPQAQKPQPGPPPSMGSSSTPLSPPPSSTTSSIDSEQSDGKYVRPQPPYGFGPNRTTSPTSRSSSSTPEDPEEFAQYCLDSLAHDKEDLRRIVQAVSTSYQAAYGGDRASQSAMTKKRLISNGLRAFFQQVTSHGLSEGLISLLLRFVESIEQTDFATADDCVRKLSSEHREESKNFVKGLKFLVSVLK